MEEPNLNPRKKAIKFIPEGEMGYDAYMDQLKHMGVDPRFHVAICAGALTLKLEKDKDGTIKSFQVVAPDAEILQFGDVAW